MIDSKRLYDALLAARSVISGDEREHPANDWWGVSIARRHLEALVDLADEVTNGDVTEPDSALDAALREVAPSGRAPRMTLDDLGGYYLYDDGSIWQLISFSDRPTATLERRSGLPRTERRGGVVGAPIFAGFRKLVPRGSRVIRATCWVAAIAAVWALARALDRVDPFEADYRWSSR